MNSAAALMVELPSPKYYGFQPEFLSDGVVLGVEQVQDMVGEIAVLHSEHYAETETKYLDVPLAPDYVRGANLEFNGDLVTITARKLGKMVGYMHFFLSRDIHSAGTLRAVEDAFFVTKDCRGTSIGPKMLAYAEKVLAELGCSYVSMSSKAPVGGPDLDKFLRRKGYAPFAVAYIKKLES